MPRLYSLRLRPIRNARPRAPVAAPAPAPEPVVEAVPEPVSQAVGAAFDAISEPEEAPEPSLFSMSKLALIELASRRGLDTSGSRAEILGRLSRG